MKKRIVGRKIKTPIFITIVCIFVSGCSVYKSPPPPPPPPAAEPAPAPAPAPEPAPQLPQIILEAQEPILVDATRIFTSPGMFPPSSFAAYGIVAFGSLPMLSDRDRHMMICEAYTAALPHAVESDVQQTEQLVTVWPVKDNNSANFLNYYQRDLVNPCRTAVDNYDLFTARKAISDAKQAGAKLAGNGPYLLAWSPSHKKGQSDALVLIADLSTVTTPEQIVNVFNAWRDDIERDPQLWKNGWDLNRVRLKIQQWADLYGKRIITMFIQ